jgi:hypothetical protein
VYHYRRIHIKIMAGQIAAVAALLLPLVAAITPEYVLLYQYSVEELEELTYH